MFKTQNRIIIVDDNQRELDTLSQSFLDNGIGCRPFQYINTYNEPLTNVRIAFFDINLAEKTIDDSGKDIAEVVKLNTSVYNDLAFAINQYIHKDNGPYALFFWTKNTSIIDGFIEFMRDPRRGYTDTASPIFIGNIDKTEISIDVEENVENTLSKRVLKSLNDEKIKFLFDFENKATEAGERTINRMFDIIPKDPIWGSNVLLFENLGKILSKIAASTLGFEYSKENPSKAVYEGILPIFNYELLNSECDVNWKEILSPLYAADSPKKIQYPDESIQRKVNSIFHIDNTSTITNQTRGAVFEYNFAIPFLEKVIFNLFPYFSKLEKEMNAKFNDFFSFNVNANDVEKDRIRRESKFIVIEISASCDFSQNKKRNNKYVLGLLTPTFDKQIIDSDNVSISILYKDIPEFNINGDEFCLWINYNFLFSDFQMSKEIGKPLFILKKEIMDMIGNRYANHISRIGITSF